MENLIFEVTHANWGLKKAGDWENTVFKIYDDLSVQIINNYVSVSESLSSKNNTKHTNIKSTDYQKLSDLMEKIKDVDKEVTAFDGDAWEFVYYKNNKIYIKRNMGYTYGIDILENIQKIVEKIE